MTKVIPIQRRGGLVVFNRHQTGLNTCAGTTIIIHVAHIAQQFICSLDGVIISARQRALGRETGGKSERQAVVGGWRIVGCLIASTTCQHQS